jgi:hypothetical protein
LVAEQAFGGQQPMQKSEESSSSEVSGDHAIAAQSLKEENSAVRDYVDREKETDDSKLKSALRHARNEEEEHAVAFSGLLGKAEIGADKTPYDPQPDPQAYQIYSSTMGHHVMSPAGNSQWFTTPELRDRYLKWHQGLSGVSGVRDLGILGKAEGNMSPLKPGVKHRTILPVGSQIDTDSQGTRNSGKVKVRNLDGSQKWVSVRAGQVMSREGHAISSRVSEGGQ